MMTKRKARLWLASLLLSGLTLSLGLLAGTDAGFTLMLPGALLAWPVWPEGIHTRAGPASALGYSIVYLVGNIFIWALLYRLALGIVFRTRATDEPTRT